MTRCPCGYRLARPERKVVMRRRTALHWVAAGVIGMGTFAWAQQQSTTGGGTEGQQLQRSTAVAGEGQQATTPLRLPMGVKQVEKPSSSGMYRTLARATEDAVSKNGF